MFYLISFVFFLVGFLLFFKPGFFVKFFLLLLVVVPSSNAYADIYYMHGFFVYDFFFLGLLLGAFFFVFSGASLYVGDVKPILAFSGAFFLVYLSLLLMSGGGVDKYVLRDFKLVWILLVGVFLIIVINRFEVFFSNRFVVAWVLLSSVCSFVGAFAILFGIYKIDDAFYESNSFRYLSVSTYIAAAYVLYVWYLKGKGGVSLRKEEWFAFFASVAVLLLAGTRSLLVGVVLSMAFAARMNLAKSFFYFVFVSSVFLVFYFVSQLLEVSRVTESMTAGGIFEQISSRIMPALESVSQMQAYEFVFGKGFGFTFEIPWFEYRDLDSKNNFVDSFWITSICKFGVVTFLYVYFFVRCCTYFYPSRLVVAMAVFVLFIMMTMAVPYQGIAIGLMVATSVIGRNALAK